MGIDPVERPPWPPPKSSRVFDLLFRPAAIAIASTGEIVWQHYTEGWPIFSIALPIYAAAVVIRGHLRDREDAAALKPLIHIHCDRPAEVETRRAYEHRTGGLTGLEERVIFTVNHVSCAVIKEWAIVDLETWLEIGLSREWRGSTQLRVKLTGRVNNIDFAPENVLSLQYEPTISRMFRAILMTDDHVAIIGALTDATYEVVASDRRRPDTDAIRISVPGHGAL